MVRLPFTKGLTPPWERFGLRRLSSPPEEAAKTLQVKAFPWRRLGIGLLVVVGAMLLAGSLGATPIPPFTAVEIVVSKIPGVDISQDWPASWDTILWKIRFPRIILAGLVGAALAVSGATYQGLFRNPLADPYLIGVASGAGLGAIIVLIAGVTTASAGFGILPMAAFVGAVIAVSVAYLVARRSDGLPLTTLILAGVAVSALCGAVGSLLMIRSDPDLRPVLTWLLGGFVSAQWRHSVFVLPYLIPGVLLLLAHGRVLNVMQLDEDRARQLGVNVERTKLLLIGAASLCTAAAVAFSGLIGFVGLVAPHVVRLLWGGDHRTLLPMAGLLGAAFLILADLTARTILSPTEIPVGIVTAFCGAPFFLYLLMRRRAKV
ncbi:MAG: iron ABC transporter permease [Chloroflexi bacterium]|nr:iron ABC transporter permease [Chloroflexota bacterium]